MRAVYIQTPTNVCMVYVVTIQTTKETYILLPVGTFNHLRIYLHFFIHTQQHNIYLQMKTNVFFLEIEF